MNSLFQVMLSVYFQHTQLEPSIRMRKGCRGGRIIVITRAVIVTFSCFLLLYSNEGKLRPQDDTRYFRSLHIRNTSADQRHNTNNTVTKAISYVRMRGTNTSTIMKMLILAYYFLSFSLRTFKIFKNDCVPVVLYVCGI
jgi:hypothetical protein